MCGVPLSSPTMAALVVLRHGSIPHRCHRTSCLSPSCGPVGALIVIRSNVKSVKNTSVMPVDSIYAPGSFSSRTFPDTAWLLSAAAIAAARTYCLRTDWDACGLKLIQLLNNLLRCHRLSRNGCAEFDFMKGKKWRRHVQRFVVLQVEVPHGGFQAPGRLAHLQIEVALSFLSIDRMSVVEEI